LVPAEVVYAPMHVVEYDQIVEAQAQLGSNTVDAKTTPP
jgi:hypothetical protein